MPLTDISRVTETLITLIDQVLARDTNVANVDVSAAAPDDDTAQLPNSISVHMFHVVEDPHGRNWIDPSNMSASKPIQYSPMGLVLNYIITARSTAGSDNSERTLVEQRLLGYVARAFHDYPVIDDDTVIPATPPASNPPLLETSNLRGQNNKIQIIFRPVGIEDTVNFWSAEQGSIARLCLFYEVRVILLETPVEEGSAPPVLSVAEFISVSGKLVLACTRSLFGLTMPEGHPLADPISPFRFMAASPARVTLFPTVPIPATVPPENNRITFEGAGFQGDGVWLSLNGPVRVGTGPGAADPATQRFRIDIKDTAANPDWSIEADGARIKVSIQTEVTTDDATVLTLMPGIYSARVIVGTQMSDTVPLRFLEQSSADQAFPIAPQPVRVDSLGGPAAARQFRLVLFGSYLHEDLEMEVTVAGQALVRNSDLSQGGRFDFTANTDFIDLTVDTTALVSPLPILLRINGADAPIAWGVF